MEEQAQKQRKKQGKLDALDEHLKQVEAQLEVQKKEALMAMKKF